MKICQKIGGREYLEGKKTAYFESAWGCGDDETM